jgi:hypothetical protein
MSLPGQVEGSTPAVPGFDTDTTISSALAQQCYALGYKFCLRYLSLGQEASGDLSEQEAADILNSGLALMPVQHVRESGWLPGRILGQQDGQSAAANAQGVGFPAGVNVWCDLEGVDATAQPEDVIEYCEAWYETVAAAEYVPGIYVGAGALLTGEQLYDLSFQHYWRSQSEVPDIPNREYQLFQLYPSIFIDSVSIDLDVTQDDKLGGQAQWLRVSTGS